MTEYERNGQPRRDSASLEFPADPELWAIARLVVSAVASRLDFELDALDDLRLSIDELCTLCAMNATTEDRVHLTVAWGHDHVEVTCDVRLSEGGDKSERTAERPGLLSDADLSRRILAALVDDFAISPIEDGVRQGWFRKARVASQQL